MANRKDTGHPGDVGKYNINSHALDSFNCARLSFAYELQYIHEFKQLVGTANVV